MYRIWLDEMEGAHQIDEAEAEQHGDDTHDDTNLSHVVLFHITSGESQSIRRGGDRQDHG